MESPRSLYGIALAALVLLTPTLWAQDGLRGALAKDHTSTQLLPHDLGQRIVAADFDNDHKPDGAVLLESGPLNGRRSFRIELHITAGKNNELLFSSAETALSISAIDVNRDGAPDIVVEQAFTHKRLGVWLNDGHGSFRKVKSEDYPSETESATRWQGQAPGQNCQALWLPTKIGSEVAGPLSKTVLVRDITGQRNSWLELKFALSGPRVPNPSRGPPSYSL